MEIVELPSLRHKYVAKRIRARKWTRIGITIDLPNGCMAIGDADVSSGIGQLTLDSDRLNFGLSKVTNSNETKSIMFTIDHGCFRFPNVTLVDICNSNTFVLRQRRIWSTTIDMYTDDTNVGCFTSNLLQSPYRGDLVATVPLEVAITALWSIVVRAAFSA